MADLLESGYLALIDTIYHAELERDHPLIRDIQCIEFRGHCLRLLASMSKDVLSGLVHGTLAKRHIDGAPSVVNVPGSIDNLGQIPPSEQNLPCLYACALLDEHGNPPTPEEKLRIVSIMRHYIGDDPEHLDLTLHIDQEIDNKRKPTSKESTKRGHRAYLMMDLPGLKRRKWQIRRFCNAVKQLCKPPRPSNLAHMPWLCIEDSLLPIDQMKLQNEDQSGYLRKLVTRIAELEYSGRFHDKTFILARLASEEEILFGKLLLTGIASAYYDLGSGLCIHPVGLITMMLG